MIPDEAVESAFLSMWGPNPSNPSDSGDAHLLKELRKALEAAAPHMPGPDAASVWDEAANVLYMGNAINQDHLKAMWERNPYRSQAYDQ